MAIVRTYGTLRSVTASPRLSVTSTTQNTIPYSYAYAEAYAAIYASQPSVRKCVDFLARNIAQLGLHVFRRVSDTDRVRLTDHDLARWLAEPNPYTTTYRLIENMVGDLALYFNAYWLKVRIEDPQPRIGLVRIPPPEMRVEGALLPSRFIWSTNGDEVPLAPSEVVYFNGYNPQDPLMGLSPIETLRRQIAEDIAAQEGRAEFWRKGARFGGIIERPAAAPRWTPAQKDSWREQWQSKYAGPQSIGGTPVLEDGMIYKEVGSTYLDAEYTTAHKLSGEEAASLWHIPLPLVGYLDHATFSNIREQHKQLYADCLGPWLEMVQAAIELQLLPESRDVEGVYTEFNIAEKLKGSFEEQANALRLLVGRSIMTANEGRARLNLPRMTDDESADQLAAQQGGPSDASATPRGLEPQEQAAIIVRAHLARQAVRLARYDTPEAKADALNIGRCVGELTDDLTPILGPLAALDCARRVTDHTYSLLLEGRAAFTADREDLHA